MRSTWKRKERKGGSTETIMERAARLDLPWPFSNRPPCEIEPRPVVITIIRKELLPTGNNLVASSVL